MLRSGRVRMRSSSESGERSRKNRRRRRGAAVVEFVAVAPILFLLLFGFIEFGRMVLVQQILTNASREGARRAILETADASEVEQVVSDYLADASIAPSTVTVTPSDLTTVGFGDPVTVQVEVQFNDVSWIPIPRYLGGTTLVGESTMHGERPE